MSFTLPELDHYYPALSGHVTVEVPIEAYEGDDGHIGADEMDEPEVHDEIPGTVKEAAIWYAEQMLWPVFPCNGKAPAVKGGRGCLDATTDPEQITKWWREHPGANIGLAAGKDAGWFVVDIDGRAGEQSLDDLIADHGPLPDTLVQQTGKGKHYLFAWRPGIRNSVKKTRPGIDVRSDGGYIIAAPSLHPDTGKRYVWEDNDPGDIAIAEAPEWLVAMLTQPDKPASPVWQQRTMDDVPEGARNSTAASLAGRLLRYDFLPGLAWIFLAAWNEKCCRPPLREQELYRTFMSILHKEVSRRTGKRNGSPERLPQMED